MKRNIRFLSLTLVLCMVLSMLPLTALASSLSFKDKYGTWEYMEEADGTITIIGFTAARKNIAVPQQIAGKPVKKLGDGLFQNHNDLTMIVIPSGVETIGANVFSGCEYLERVDLPGTLTAIGDGAFSDCAALGSLYIPSSVTELGEGVFADSPQLSVTCDKDSAAADYLKENRTEVPHFTLIEVQEVPAAPAPQPPQGTEGVIHGKQITYEFGKTINGKREYTLVLLDSMPDLDLSSFIIQDSQGEDMLDLQAWAVMNERFRLVSLRRYNGSNMEVMTPKEEGVGVYPTYRWEEGGIADVGYILEMEKLDDRVERIAGMEFSSSGQLLGYYFDKWDDQKSVTKKDSGSLAWYYLSNTDYEGHYADGQLIQKDDSIYASVHEAAVDGSCVEIYIHDGIYSSVERDEQKVENRYVTVKDGNGKKITASVHQNTEKDGTVYQSGSYSVVSGNQPIETAHQSVKLDDKGTVTNANKSVTAPVADGVYQWNNTHYQKENTWDSSSEDHYAWEDQNGNTILEDLKVSQHTTEKDSLYYDEHTVYAENVQECHELFHTQFPNEPDEHTAYVSEKNIRLMSQHTAEVSIEDLNTGVVENRKYAGSWENLKNHIYIGETGKYVGWDWSWDYHQEIDPQTDEIISQRGYYLVREYSYSAENDTWTKTEVVVDPIDGQSVEAFKETVTQGAMKDYSMYFNKYVFDASVEGGADNWRYQDISEETEEEYEKRMAEAEAIAMGTTSVTVGDTTIMQEEKKQEMLDLEQELKDEVQEGTVENYFEEVLSTVPDGDELLAEVENALETNTVPESNTTEEWEHDCYGGVGVGDLTEENAGSPATTLGAEADAPAEPVAATVSAEPDAALQDAEEAA